MEEEHLYLGVLLLSAVKKGDYKKAKLLLRAGAPASGSFTIASGFLHDGFHALHWAIYNERPDLIALLLQYGADLKIQDAHRRTPIVLASALGYKECVRALAKHETDAADAAGYGSALLDAVRSEDSKTAELLLQAGAPPQGWVSEAPNEACDGFSSLHWAVYNKQRDLINLLLQYGADLTAKDKKGRTPLQLAAELNYTNYVKFFEVIQAIKNRNKKELFDLLQQIPDSRVKQFIVKSTIAYAEQNSDCEEFRFALLLHLPEQKLYAFHNAIRSDSSEKVREIVERAKNEDMLDKVCACEDKAKKTPFQLALENFNSCTPIFIEEIAGEDLESNIPLLIEAAKKSKLRVPDFEKACFAMGEALFGKEIAGLEDKDKLAQKIAWALTFFVLSGDHAEANSMKFFCYRTLANKKGLDRLQSLEEPLFQTSADEDKKKFQQTIRESGILEHLEGFSTTNNAAAKELAQLYFWLEDDIKCLYYLTRAHEQSAHDDIAIVSLAKRLIQKVFLSNEQFNAEAQKVVDSDKQAELTTFLQQKMSSTAVNAKSINDEHEAGKKLLDENFKILNSPVKNVKPELIIKAFVFGIANVKTQQEIYNLVQQLKGYYPKVLRKESYENIRKLAKNRILALKFDSCNKETLTQAKKTQIHAFLEQHRGKICLPFKFNKTTSVKILEKWEKDPKHAEKMLEKEQVEMKKKMTCR